MPLRFWIVCLMLALLPMRGWVAASMTVPAAVADAAVLLAHEAEPASPAAPPCHEATTTDDASPGGHVCNLCALCHAATADLAVPTVPQLTLRGDTPSAAVARDTGRPAVGALERPPRHRFA